MCLNLTVFILLSIVWILCQANEIIHSSFNRDINIVNASFAVVVLCTNSNYFCSGVIVDEKWVLTAAHCLHDLSGKLTETPDSILIVAGTDSLSNAAADIKSEQAQIRKSKTIAVHSNYTWEENFFNDIVLVEVSEKFYMSERVSVVTVKGEMNSAEVNHFDHDNQLKQLDVMAFCCDMYSYGPASSKASSRILHRESTFNKHCHCLEKIRSYKSPFDVLRPINFFLCDSFSDRIKMRLCSGDNGGPLMCNGALRAIVTTIFHYNETEECVVKHGNAQQEECGGRHSLNVFTDLCYHNKWLRSVIPSYPRQDELCRILGDLYIE